MSCYLLQKQLTANNNYIIQMLYKDCY